MRPSVVAAVIAAAVAALVGAVVIGFLRSEPSPQQSRVGGQTSANSSPAARVVQSDKLENTDTQLTERLKTLCSEAGGEIGVAVVHVETGRYAVVGGAKQLPLYSVFKLPLAIEVLKSVEEKQLLLDKKVRVTPDDVASGSQFNADLWRSPVEKSVAELLEYSIVRSDNTSSDKLLELVGGPAAVTRRMLAFGLSNINIQYTTREFAARRDKPNTGSATDLAYLLARLQKGEILQPPQLTLLLEFMARSMTGGERRLRADLPTGTAVADKTGTGEPGSSTNDVGLITLPQGKGHLAVAVLVSGSKLPVADQEKLIAQIARAAYDSNIASSRGN